MPARPVLGRRGWPATLADPGYDGAGIGILIPVKQPPGGRELDLKARTRNARFGIPCAAWANAGRLLTGRWYILRQITASPSKIGDIARATLVLTRNLGVRRQDCPDIEICLSFWPR